MLRVTVVLVLAAVAWAAKDQTNYTEVIKTLEANGSSLEGSFSRQWAEVLAGQRKRILAVQSSLLKKQGSAASKAALSNAFSQLNKNLAKVDIQADAFTKQQGKEVQECVHQYVTLLQQRVKATGASATDEAPLRQLRTNKMNMLRQWENRMLQVNSQYRAAYRAALGAASKAAASQPTVRQALRTAFTTIFEEAIDDQEENITTLSAKQFPMVEEFALLAGKRLLQLLVAAQGALL